MTTPRSFREKVYALTKQIPIGKVMTYGQMAKLAGSPGAARAVGMCMKQNPDPETIPCHRLVASDGSLTGYAFGKGISSKREMLISEGVAFHGDKVDLQHSQWFEKASRNSVEQTTFLSLNFLPDKLYNKN